jgi:DNA helicase-2/ATP-dependent DNA helicase PcrA
MEIKNALAYLRLASNPHDDASFERIVNTPTRGIGAKTLDDMRGLARQQQLSLWQAALSMLEHNQLPPRASNALQGFLNLIMQLGQNHAEQALYEIIQHVIESSGLLEFYKKEKQDKNEARVENLEELVNAARLFDFDSANPENAESMSELDLFLTHAALEAGESQADPEQDCVQLMTLHSAKGLEFKLVFMVGMEDGLFPSLQSLDDIGRLQEERRLCYVGITRAMQQLYLSHAESRRLYGKDSYPRPSRFLREIPAETLQEIRMRANITRSTGSPASQQPASISTGSYRLGQSVKHEKFGEGVVLQTEGEGEQERVQINFRHAGIKWLMLAYAKLERIG